MSDEDDPAAVLLLPFVGLVACLCGVALILIILDDLGILG